MNAAKAQQKRNKASRFKAQKGAFTVARKEFLAYQLLSRMHQVRTWLEAVFKDEPAVGLVDGELAPQLASGVLLCHLANKMGGDIKRISTKTGRVGAAGQRENVVFFVEFLEAKLGPRSGSLFSAPDLSEGKDMPRVIDALFDLATLANKEKTILIPIQGGNAEPAFDEAAIAEATKLVQASKSNAKAPVGEAPAVLQRKVDEARKAKEVTDADAEQKSAEADAAEAAEAEAQAAAVAAKAKAAEAQAAAAADEAAAAAAADAAAAAEEAEAKAAEAAATAAEKKAAEAQAAQAKRDQDKAQKAAEKKAAKAAKAAENAAAETLTAATAAIDLDRRESTASTMDDDEDEEAMDYCLVIPGSFKLKSETDPAGTRYVVMSYWEWERRVKLKKANEMRKRLKGKRK